MTDDEMTRMLVLVDSPTGAEGIREIGRRYSSQAEEITPANLDVTAPYSGESPTRSELGHTIDHLLGAAAERRIPWVGIRRDLNQPMDLLRDLLLAAGRNASPELPGFAVFLAEGEVEPITRILAIVDRRDGGISGLLVHTAVTVAEASGATLDILVIAAHGEDFSSESAMGSLAVNREQDLHARAVDRAERAGLPINWIMAAGVTDTWSIVRNQMAGQHYNLVIDDLGDISLGGALRRGNALEKVLGPRKIGEVPLRLLSEYFNPVLLVIDGIQLGMAPSALLRAGAVAALAMGVVSTGLSVGVTPSVSAATQKGGKERVDELMSQLEGALGTDAGDRAREVTGASRSGADRDRKAGGKKAPKAPKGGADTQDVAKAQRSLAQTKSDYDKALKRLERAKAQLEAAEAEREQATQEAEAALAQLEQARLALQQEQARSSPMGLGASVEATGMGALLPGPAPEEASPAEGTQTMADYQLDRATDQGREALDALLESGDALAQAQVKVDAAKETRAEVKEDLDLDRETLEVYKESLAKSRQAPVRKGNYRLTARFGQAGGYWSSGRHTGLDFAGATGTDVHAAATGRVVSAGWAGAYGNRVEIDHGNGYTTTYNHLSRITVNVGQHVRTGDHVGDIGSTGNSTGAHLHFEVLKNGTFINPAVWLGW